MTTHFSVTRIVTATDHDAGMDAFAQVSRHEAQAGILELSVRISRRFALLQASSDDLAHDPDDLAAIAWAQRSMEDVEATIIGLSEAHRRRSAVVQSLGP